MELERFEKRTITFCEGISVDGYLLPDGEFRVGIAGASRTLGFAENWLGKELSKLDRSSLFLLQEHGFSGELKTGMVARDGTSGSSKVSTISLDDFNFLVSYSVYKGKKEAEKIQVALNQRLAKMMRGDKLEPFEIIPFNESNKIETQEKKQLTKNTEKKIQLSLARQLINPSLEVQVPAGKIDILTSEELIEVKEWQRWKEAVGQVICYGYYYPSHRKRIHFFGNAHSDFIAMVYSHCERQGIEISWE